jgi:hypothetical protein
MLCTRAWTSGSSAGMEQLGRTSSALIRDEWRGPVGRTTLDPGHRAGAMRVLAGLHRFASATLTCHSSRKRGRGDYVALDLTPAATPAGVASLGVAPLDRDHRGLSSRQSRRRGNHRLHLIQAVAQPDQLLNRRSLSKAIQRPVRFRGSGHGNSPRRCSRAITAASDSDSGARRCFQTRKQRQAMHRDVRNPRSGNKWRDGSVYSVWDGSKMHRAEVGSHPVAKAGR